MVDNGNFMHIWDLSPLGCPKHLAVVRWDSVMYTQDARSLILVLIGCSGS